MKMKNAALAIFALLIVLALNINVALAAVSCTYLESTKTSTCSGNGFNGQWQAKNGRWICITSTCGPQISQGAEKYISGCVTGTCSVLESKMSYAKGGLDAALGSTPTAMVRTENGGGVTQTNAEDLAQVKALSSTTSKGDSAGTNTGETLSTKYTYPITGKTPVIIGSATYYYDNYGNVIDNQGRFRGVIDKSGDFIAGEGSALYDVANVAKPLSTSLFSDKTVKPTAPKGTAALAAVPQPVEQALPAPAAEPPQQLTANQIETLPDITLMTKGGEKEITLNDQDYTIEGYSVIEGSKYTYTLLDQKTKLKWTLTPDGGFTQYIAKTEVAAAPAAPVETATVSQPAPAEEVAVPVKGVAPEEVAVAPGVNLANLQPITTTSAPSSEVSTAAGPTETATMPAATEEAAPIVGETQIGPAETAELKLKNLEQEVKNNQEEYETALGVSRDYAKFAAKQKGEVSDAQFLENMKLKGNEDERALAEKIIKEYGGKVEDYFNAQKDKMDISKQQLDIVNQEFALGVRNDVDKGTAIFTDQVNILKAAGVPPEVIATLETQEDYQNYINTKMDDQTYAKALAASGDYANVGDIVTMKDGSYAKVDSINPDGTVKVEYIGTGGETNAERDPKTGELLKDSAGNLVYKTQMTDLHGAKSNMLWFDISQGSAIIMQASEYVDRFKGFADVMGGWWLGGDKAIQAAYERVSRSFCEEAYGVFGGRQCWVSRICSTRNWYTDSKAAANAAYAYDLGSGNGYDSIATINADKTTITHYNASGKTVSENLYRIDVFVKNNKPGDDYVHFELNLVNKVAAGDCRDGMTVKTIQEVLLNSTNRIYNHRSSRMITKLSSTPYDCVCIEWISPPAGLESYGMYQQRKYTPRMCAQIMNTGRELSQPPAVAVEPEQISGTAPTTTTTTGGSYETGVATDW